MKTKVKALTCLLLFIASISCYNSQVHGQGKINISTGFGVPELYNIGMRYQIDQTQVGFSVGGVPFNSDGKIFSISGELYYHFAGDTKLSDRRPWFLKMGLTYLRDENEKAINKTSYLNTRLGRDFFLSKNIGIQIDGGAIFQLSSKTIRKKPSSGLFSIDFPVLPSFGIELFFQL